MLPHQKLKRTGGKKLKAIAAVAVLVVAVAGDLIPLKEPPRGKKPLTQITGDDVGVWGRVCHLAGADGWAGGNSGVELVIGNSLAYPSIGFEFKCPRKGIALVKITPADFKDSCGFQMDSEQKTIRSMPVGLG